MDHHTRIELPLAAKVVNMVLPPVVAIGVTAVTGNPVAGRAAGTATRVATFAAPEATAGTAALVGMGIILLPVCFLMGPVFALIAGVGVPLQLAYELIRGEPDKTPTS